MAPRSASKPTIVPPQAILTVAPIPPPPPQSTTEEATRWHDIHHFRNTIDAIRDHLQPPGTQTAHLNTLTWLYYNQYIAAAGARYTNERSLTSRYSRDHRAEGNIHLATIGCGTGTTAKNALARWNEYLEELGLPRVTKVGTGLPDSYRCRDVWAARVLLDIARAVAPPMAVTPPADLGMAAETTRGILGGADPSAAASTPVATSQAAVDEAARPRASVEETISRAANEEAAIRHASVQEAINGVTEQDDEELILALHLRRNLIPRHRYESEDDAITRLAVEFLGSEPFATARDALIELVRADWDIDVALNNWSPEYAEEGNGDDGGQPPQKRRRLNDDDDSNDEGGDGRGKGKGKERAD